MNNRLFGCQVATEAITWLELAKSEFRAKHGAHASVRESSEVRDSPME